MIEGYIAALKSFQSIAEEILDVSKTANKNKKSLSGSNFYGEKFRSLELELVSHRTTIERLLEYIDELSEADIQRTHELIESISSAATPYVNRRTASHDFKIMVRTKLLPRLEGVKQTLPKSQQVLPFAVVDNTRGYIEQITIQFNGCYENGWYDACAVMMRKLVEILIISSYENHGRDSEIKGTDDNFLMLSRLIDKILADNKWNLSRETKKSLPDIKALGDRAAHTRLYLCTKQDVDRVIPGYRVTIEELLHIAGLK